VNDLDRIEQLDAMRMGTDYRFLVKIRGFEMYVRPLSISETIQVTASAQEKMSLLPPQSRNVLTEHTILAKETLKLASTSDVGRDDIRITDLILDRMTNDEVHYLFKQYIAATDRVNPALELMKPDDVNNLVSEIKKNKTEDVVSALTELSFTQLVSLAHHCVTQGD
jgi:hypothetical protein